MADVPKPGQSPGSAAATAASPTAQPDAARAPLKTPLSRVKPRTGAPTGPIIGIDLGTTNSCVAAVRGGKPFVIRSREGHNTIPSIVSLTAKHQLVVGHPAKAQLVLNPKQTVFGAKRLVGRPYVSDVVGLVKEHFLYEIVEGADGEAAVKLGHDVFTLQQLSAMILVEARELASQELGVEVQRAVITVPAYYNEHQRQAVRQAGALAGLHVERIINEPTAAAIAFGYGRQLEKTVLVYDLGGGTFDVSLLQLSDKVYEVIGTAGDTFLGGVDFDKAIADHLATIVQEKLGPDFPVHTVRERLVEAAEVAKRALSEQQEARVHVPWLAQPPGQPPFELDVKLTRPQVEDLVSGLVNRTMEVCMEVLKTAGKTPADIHEVILVGGQSRMPMVHDTIESWLFRAPNSAVHPDEAVALGAALFAHSLGLEEGVTLIDVLPMSIGVGLPGGRYKRIIERNTKLPHARTYGIATVRDDQEELEISIYQGEGELTDDVEYLGTAKLGPLPRGPKGAVTLAVEFALSSECLLTVTARDAKGRFEVKSVFSTRDTPEVVKARVARAERIAAAVKAAKTAAANKQTSATAAPAGGGFLSRLIGRMFGGRKK